MKMKVKLIGKIFDVNVGEISMDNNYSEVTYMGGDKVFVDGSKEYSFDMSITLNKMKFVDKIKSKYFDNFKGRTLVIALEEMGEITEIFMPNSFLTSMSMEYKCGELPIAHLAFSGRSDPIIHKRIDWGF